MQILTAASLNANKVEKNTLVVSIVGVACSLKRI